MDRELGIDVIGVFFHEFGDVRRSDRIIVVLNSAHFRINVVQECGGARNQLPIFIDVREIRFSSHDEVPPFYRDTMIINQRLYFGKGKDTMAFWKKKKPKPQDGTWWIWDAAQQKYLDSGISCELVGPTGNGIQDIQLTSGDHTPGTTDVYTVTMTDGTTTTISVYNGRNGTGAGDVLGIAFDLVLPASGWVNGELTVADSRLLALATHKYFIDADETSREEYLECGVQARNITTTGFITFKSDTDPTADLTVNVIRLELSANGS